MPPGYKDVLGLAGVTTIFKNPLNAKANHFKSREQHNRKTDFEPEHKVRNIFSDCLWL